MELLSGCYTSGQPIPEHIDELNIPVAAQQQTCRYICDDGEAHNPVWLWTTADAYASIRISEPHTMEGRHSFAFIDNELRRLIDALMEVHYGRDMPQQYVLGQRYQYRYHSDDQFLTIISNPPDDIPRMACIEQRYAYPLARYLSMLLARPELTVEQLPEIDQVLPPTFAASTTVPLKESLFKER